MIEFLASLGVSAHLKDLPFESEEDVLALFPRAWRDTPSEVLQAIVAGIFSAIFRRASDVAAYAASGSTHFASGASLDIHGQDVDVSRVESESDDDYRERACLPDFGLTPRAIMERVNKLIAPHTSAKAWYAEEPDDGGFIFTDDGTLTDENAMGCYIGDVMWPVEDHHRKWHLRPQSRPNAWLVFGSTTEMSPRIAGAPYGVAIVGIPDIFPSHVGLTDYDIVATSDGSDSVAFFSESGLESGYDGGAVLESASKDRSLVVGQIRAMLDAEQAFPYRALIYLDPLL
jgi:hypothetical protein